MCSTALEKRVSRGDRHSGACDSFPAAHPTLGLGEGPALCSLCPLHPQPEHVWCWMGSHVCAAGSSHYKKNNMTILLEPWKSKGSSKRHRRTQIICSYPQPWDALFPSPIRNHSRFLRYHPNSIPFLTLPLPSVFQDGSLPQSCLSPLWLWEAEHSLDYTAAKPLQPHKGQVTSAPEVKRPKLLQGIQEISITARLGIWDFPVLALISPSASPHSTESQNHGMLRGLNGP